MSPTLSSQGVALATAMAVSAGTVILLACRLQRVSPTDHRVPLRSCISSEGKKKKKKRVHFAEDVVEPRGDGDEFRRKLKLKNRAFDSIGSSSSSSSSSASSSSSLDASRSFQKNVKKRGMPENRAVLYNGILRDRVVHHRFAYYSC